MMIWGSLKGRLLWTSLFAAATVIWPLSHANAQCTLIPTESVEKPLQTLPIEDHTPFLGSFEASIWLNPFTGKQGLTITVSGQPPFDITDTGTVNGFINGICDGQVLSKFRRTLSEGRPKALGASEPFGQAIQGITSGDFNGDGIVDTAAVGNSNVVITLYNSDGTTLGGYDYQLPSTAEQGIAVADFNGDGKLDLAILQDPIGSATTGSIALLLGNGDGTFGAAVTIPVSVAAAALALGDFNGDGKPDLAVVGGGLAVLLGNGDGTFAPLSAVPFANSERIAAVDLNGDGKLDLLAATPSGFVDVYPGNGNGSFGPAIESPNGAISILEGLAYADLNGDGNLDYLIVDPSLASLFVGFGNGNGTFQAPQKYVAPANAQSVGAIPLADGNTAILMEDGLAQSLLIALADTTGSVELPSVQTIGAATQEYVPSIAAADLNGDSKPDLVITEASGIAVASGNGDGSFATPVLYQVTGAPNELAILDLNGDGKPDLFVTQASGANILLNNGDGTFSAGQAFTTGPLRYVAVADFNGDGKPDVAVESDTPEDETSAPSTVSILLSNGNGSLAAPLSFPLPAPGPGLGGALLSGDFNGDGNADLIAAYSSADAFTGTLALYPGNGNGSFGAPSVLAVTGNFLAAGDLNGDGKLDLVVFDIESDTLYILLGEGNGSFETPLATTTGNIASITVADLNGDGKPDLVFGDCCGNAEASYMLGNGAGTFGAQSYFLAGSNPASLVVGNFDGSGAASIAAAGEFGFATDTPTLTVVKTAFPANVAVVSSAYPQATGLAPGMLATAYGADLANTSNAPSLPLPLADSGTSVSLTDSSGAVTAAPLLYISPGQVNLEVPITVATGPATVNVISGDGAVSSESVQIATVVPGVFALNSSGLAAADVLTINGGTQTYGNVYAISGGVIVPMPIDVGAGGGQVYLLLYGTGFQAAGTAGVTVTIDGVATTVSYAGMQGSFAGLDQANVLLPVSLAGKGQVTIQLTANGITANPVNVTIQ